MQQFVLSKEWAFACRNPQKTPPNLSPHALEEWLKQHTPIDSKCIPSAYPYIRSVDEGYPEELHGYQAPPVLFYRGNISLLHKPKIAIVGTRKASVLGVEFCKLLSSFLYNNDIISVSGLAHGIDEVVHHQALSKTIGILACGFGDSLSSKTKHLCQKIVDAGGLIVSEFPPNTPPRKWRFIQRNRIIAWLGKEVILVEAPHESGTLHTIKNAMDRNKHIWIVPSSPLSHTNRGGLALIAAGFPPLCSIQQLAHHLQLSYKAEKKSILSFSEFAQYSNMSTKDAMKELTKLELHGTIKTLQNGYFVWNPSS